MPRNALGRGSERSFGSLSSTLLQHHQPAAQERLHHHIQLRPEVRPLRLPQLLSATPAGPLQIDIDLIEPSPYQPRTRFREEALDELARSIQASGIIQPIVVRPLGNRYQLIAGERRWRLRNEPG